MGNLAYWVEGYKFNRECKLQFNAEKDRVIRQIENSRNQAESLLAYYNILKKVQPMDIEQRQSYILQLKQTSQSKILYKILNNPVFHKIILNDNQIAESIISAYNDYAKAKHDTNTLNDRLRVMRPDNYRDMMERKVAVETFKKAMQDIDRNDLLKLRFHATDIVSSKKIIESGGIISIVDRNSGSDKIGHRTRGSENEIAVSSINDLEHSISMTKDAETILESNSDEGRFTVLKSRDFANLLGLYQCVPAGCLFVLRPDTQEEIDMIANRSMHNVYFHQNPEKFIGVVTTSENLPVVQKWLEENGLNPALASTFKDFPEQLKKRMEPVLNAMRENSQLVNEGNNFDNDER